ncbi:GTPase-activating protein [Podila minutissima]|uniref:GTPase-activating protein n=1 Tax=Podila minutissima TaxID=64525 RepID=A0A9P5SJU4_9FUNG|nr:GTPase-activating protein [Podila minutissima]
MTTINNAHAVSYSSDEDNDYDPYEGYGPEETEETQASGHHAPSSDIDLSDYEEEPHRPSSFQAHHHDDLKQAPPKSPVSTRSSVSFYDIPHQDNHSAHASQRSSPYQSRRTSALDHHHSPASPTHSFHSHRSSELRSPILTTNVPQDSWGHALAPAQETAEISRNSWEENDSEEDPYPADAYDYGRESESSDEDDYEERRVSQVSKKSFGEFDPNNHEAPVAKETHAGYDSDDYEERRASHVSKKSFGDFDPNNHVASTHAGYDSDDYEERRASYMSKKSFGDVDPNDHVAPVAKETHAGYDSDDYYESQHQSQQQEKQYEDDQDDYYGNNKKYGHDSPRSSMDSVDKRSSIDVQEARIAQAETTTVAREPFFDVKDEPKNLFVDNRASVASVASAKSFSSNNKHRSFGYEDRPAEEPSASESESESDSGDHKTAIVTTTAIATAAAAAAVMAAVSLGTSSPKPPPVPTKSRPTSVLAAASISTPGSPVHSRGMTPGHAIEVAHPSAPVDVVRSPPASPVVSKATPIAAPISATIPPPAPEAALVVDTFSQKSVSSASSVDQRQRRYSGSDSDTSGTSIDLHSPTLKSHMNSRPNVYTRSMSTSSASRDMGGSNSLDKQRPISYATVFSDAELNDISLDEPMNEKRASNIPPTPATPSAFGFPSSFFGGRPHPKAQAPPPQQQTPSPPTPTPAPPPPPPADPRANMTRSNSISALASSLQGAFRGFGASASPPPPPTPKIPTQISRASDVGFFSSNSRNSHVPSDRASTISNVTTDSNMDLLLARLEAQNEMLEKDSKQRKITHESEMDRAIGHAKEESAGENIDWDYWGALMHDYNGVVKKNPRQLTTMIQKGVPSALRGSIWQSLAKSKDTQLEGTYAELLKSTSTHEKQITRDMSRTFPNHEYFQTEGPGQEALFNVVKAYSLYDPEVGYCQGLSFVVGPLLLNMPDEEAFCLLVRMMNSYEMRGHYTPEMNMLQLRLYQFEQLMEETVPLVFKHLRNQGIRSTMYASQWFMTLFAYKFPLELVFRVYDIIFVEGVDSLLRFAIALLKTSHDKILSLDFDVLIEFLKNGLFEPYMNDSSLFIQDAYNVKVTPKKLSQYAQKYQAMIQKQQAEQAAEESLKESNRQLSDHVRQLEGSMHTLNKEHIDLAKELITRKMEMAQLQDQNDVLSQKVTDLTKIVDSQAKEVEEQFKGEIENVLQKNMELLKKNEALEDQMVYLENLVIETKMRYAESENERDALSRKLSDMRKALGMV